MGNRDYTILWFTSGSYFRRDSITSRALISASTSDCPRRLERIRPDCKAEGYIVYRVLPGGIWSQKNPIS